MTGMLIVAALVIVLAVALGPAHRRRSFGSFSPADASRDAGVADRDAARTVTEIRAASQRESLRIRPLVEIAARGQGAIPMHRRRIGRRVGEQIGQRAGQEPSVPVKDSRAA